MADEEESAGWIGLTDYNSEHNAHHFMVRRHLANLRTNVMVKVVAVKAGKYPHSFEVDVMPLVNQVDGAGNKQEHGTVFGIPMLSGSGGNGAVITKPKVGDMGLMAVGDRDHSAAIAANGQANPGSRRTHSMSDGVFLGGFCNQNNSGSYIVLDENGVTIHGNVTVTGKVTASDEVTAMSGTSGGVKLSTHRHPDPQGGNTSPPTPGG